MRARIGVGGIYSSLINATKTRAALASAVDCFVVRFQIDRNYRTIELRVEEFVGFSPTSKTFVRAVLVAKISQSDFRNSPDRQHLHAMELKLSALKHDCYYRFTLLGRKDGHATSDIDQRLFLYNGAHFVEAD